MPYISWRLWGMVWVFVFIGGCGDGLQPRLPSLIGTEVYRGHSMDSKWLVNDRIGLTVYSAVDAPDAAPGIPPAYLTTLRNRIEDRLQQHCEISVVMPIVFPTISSSERRRTDLLSQAKEYELSHVLLVVLSSREHASPVTLGEERMMTQMSGMEVENTALAEVALLRLADFQIVFAVQASAKETLELLDAPIGSGQPTPEESMGILRAQAGQQALDRAWEVLGSDCQRLKFS